ncbi:MAG: hypothetical protein JWM80_4454 [Cyanobacteria bacterium RYN_339]|nr:hypothetical protein [Cyanobacteria bacterium RYN_339]
MEPSTDELQIAMAELLASLARRMTVLHAAGHAAGLLHTPPPNLPERLAEHVRYYAGIMRRNPSIGPTVEEVLDRFAGAGRDLARLENEVEDPDAAFGRVREHQRFLLALPTAFVGCEPLQQLFAPKAPAAPAAPPASVRSPTGRLMPLQGRSPTRPLFPENQALLDKGLAQLRALDARMMLIRVAAAMAANPALPPSLALPPQARETAKRLAVLLAVDLAALASFKRLADHHAQTKKIFDQRPIQQPDAARAALDQLVVLAEGLGAYPAIAKLLESR